MSYCVILLQVRYQSTIDFRCNVYYNIRVSKNETRPLRSVGKKGDIMKVKNKSGEVVEIPSPSGRSPWTIKEGDPPNPEHGSQWKNHVIVENGVAIRRNNFVYYYDFCYYWKGEVYFPIEIKYL